MVDTLDGRHVGVQAQVHAGLDHFAGNEGAHFLVKAAQHLMAPVDLRDVGTHAIEDRRKLAGNVAAADHQQALREGRQVEHLVGTDDVFAARKLRNAGFAARGDQNIFGAVMLAADVHRVRIDQRGPAVEGVHACAFEQLHVNAVEARNLAGAVGLEGVPVQHGCFAGPAEAVRFLEAFGEMGSVTVEFFRNAAQVDAGASHVGHFGQADADAALRCHACRTNAATAAANHKKVKVKNLHKCFLFTRMKQDLITVRNLFSGEGM